jgi:hypothetical protein
MLFAGRDEVQVSGEPQVLRPSKRRMLTWVGVCLAFVAAGAFLTTTGEFVWGVAAVGFFGLGAIVLGITLLPGASFLKLEREGFEVRSLYRSGSYRWSDVQEFRPVAIPPSGVMLAGFDFSPNARPAAAWLSSSVAGVEGCLPDTYGLSAEELAGVMEAWRTRHTESPSQLAGES